MNLYLVRHGRPLIDTSVPASQWEQDPAAAPEIRALAERLPSSGNAHWFASAEPNEPDLERWQHLRMPDVITIPG